MRLKGLEVLNRRAEIASIKDSPLRACSRNVVVQAAKEEIPRLGKVGVVFVVGKKSGKAVSRNRIKRRLRAAFSILVAADDVGFPLSRLRYIIVGRSKAFYSRFEHVQNDILLCLKTISTINKQRPGDCCDEKKERKQ